MKTHRGPGAATFVAGFALFCAGAGVGWRLHAGAPEPAIAFNEAAGMDHDPIAPPSADAPVTTLTPAPPAPVASIGPMDAVEELREKHLQLPIDGANVDSFKNSFAERRGGSRPHEAADMLAPRNTPIRAVEDGKIVKLFLSKLGGITIYQFDPSEHFCYYYAHLERYADGLKEGQIVKRGDVLGYVGTSGNAPPDTPHLHFAVSELTADRH